MGQKQGPVLLSNVENLISLSAVLLPEANPCSLVPLLLHILSSQLSSLYEPVPGGKLNNKKVNF